MHARSNSRRLLACAVVALATVAAGTAAAAAQQRPEHQAVAVVAAVLPTVSSSSHLSLPSTSAVTWRAEANSWPSDFFILDKAGCAPSLHCLAFGTLISGPPNNLYDVTYDATSTSKIRPLRVVRGTLHQVFGVSCSSSMICEAIGQNGSGNPTAARTTNGGATWQLQSLPASELLVDQIECFSSNDCLAIGLSNSRLGASTLFTKNAGHHWAQGGYFDRAYYYVSDSDIPQDLQCVSSQVCFDSTGSLQKPGEFFETQNGGQTWALTYTAPGRSEEVGPSYCASQTRCVVLLQTESSNSSTSTSVPVWLTKTSAWTSQAGPKLVDRFGSTMWCTSSDGACVVTGFAEGKDIGRAEEIVKGASGWKFQAVQKEMGGIGSTLHCLSLSDCFAISSITGEHQKEVVVTNRATTSSAK